MTIEGTQEPVVEAEPQAPPEQPAPPSDANAELRAHAARQESAAKVLREQLLEVRLQELGLEKGKGVGKAIFQGYTEDDLSPQAVAEYAKAEWGHERADTVQAQVVSGAQTSQALDNAAIVSSPSQAPNEYDQIQADMLDPEKIDRSLAERSISSKIGHFFFPNQQ